MMQTFSFKKQFGKKQKGFSLMELMVSTVAGMIIVAGATNVYLTTIISSSDTLKQSKLNQVLSTAMSVMANDIIRAGATGNVNYTSPQSNVYSQVDNTALEVIDSMTNNAQVAWANAGTGGSCILYTYDSALDATDAVANGDIFGFRLNGDYIEMRRQGDVVNNTRHDSCNDADDTWQVITDENVIKITNLNFTFGSSRCINTREPNGVDDDGDGATSDTDEMDCYTIAPATGDITVEVRQIDISLAGQLVSDPSVTVSLNQSVRVRNDLVRVIP